jgi:hypothetical protein
MSNYFDAVNILRGSARNIIGAEGPTLPTKRADFQAIADKAFRELTDTKPWTMIRVEDDGKVRSFTFDDGDAAKGAFSAVSAQTPGSALVALYERGGVPELFDTTFRPPRVFETVTVLEKKELAKKDRAIWPWLLGGAGVGIIGALIAKRKRGSHGA